MTVIISGTDGVSDVDGTAGTPAIRGTDANTGIFFPAADTIAFAEGGAEAMRIDSAGNVGIGTTSPSQKLHVAGKTLFATSSGSIESGFTSGGSNAFALLFASSTSGTLFMGVNGTAAGSPIDVGGILDNASYFGSRTNHATQFLTNNTVRATIDTTGNFLVGTTSINPHSTGTFGSQLSAGGASIGVNNSHAIIAARWNGNGEVIRLQRDNTDVGSIDVTTTATSYNTSSDYRLKHDITPMTGALDKVALLKPVTYKWNADNSADEGFIAHELAEVCPSAVSGEKDAVETYTDEDGVEQTRIKPQGIDTSFLVATLTAAIQELKAINDAQAQTIESLTARIAALEAQ